MNRIHPTAIIAGDVVLGERNTIGPFVVVNGPVTIGDDNWFGAGTTIGAAPEVRSFTHPRVPEDPWGVGVTIGSRNTIREYVQIHQGWKHQTTVADETFVMNQCYIAHDSSLDDGATLASSVLLAGHVKVAAGANLGLGTAVHQFCTVGRGSMVGMGSVVVKDVPPFAKAYGNPATVHGANSVGMQRAGIGPEIIELLSLVFSGASDAEEATALASLDVNADEDVRNAVRRWAERAR